MVIFRVLVLASLFIIIQLTSRPVIACVEGLTWGMDLSTVEGHLGVSFKPINDGLKSEFFEIKNVQLSDLPVKNLRVRVDDEQGLKQLAYEMDYENMTEVLAGLRHRFGPPVSTSVEVDGRSPQQQWVWHTGEDVITAIKSEQRLFVLSYRPSLLDPSFL